MALTDGTLIKKYHVALFINTGTSDVPVWTRIQKSTDNTITSNASTTEFDFIVDESPSTVLDYYKPSLSQPITMYKGNDDYEYFFDMFFNLKTGDDAVTDILIVFYASNDGDSYKAWKAECVMVSDNMNPVASTITTNINFNGTVDTGLVEVTDGTPVYTSDSETEFTFTVTVLDSESAAAEGVTVMIGGVEETTDSSGEATFTLIDGNTYTVGATDGTYEASDVFTADSGTTSVELTLA